MLAELLAEIPTALLAEIFLLPAENSRNFKPYFNDFYANIKINFIKDFSFSLEKRLLFPNLTLGTIILKKIIFAIRLTIWHNCNESKIEKVSL